MLINSHRISMEELTTIKDTIPYRCRSRGAHRNGIRVGIRPGHCDRHQSARDGCSIPSASAVGSKLTEALNRPVLAQPYAGSSVYLPLIENGELALGVSSTVDSARVYNAEGD